jgi:hypothetical protein
MGSETKLSGGCHYFKKEGQGEIITELKKAEK